MNARTEQREKVKARIVTRAGKDGAFKALLVKDPRKAVESELGAPLPPHVQFHIVEESAANIYVVLPEVQHQELSDADLESISGGADFTNLMY